MTTQERWALYENGEFRQTIAVKLLDWAGYWTTAGIDGITEPLLKAQTKRAVEMVVQDLSYVIGIVTSLAISDSAIASIEVEEVTEAIIASVITTIMTYKLAWVTGIFDLPQG